MSSQQLSDGIAGASGQTSMVPEGEEIKLDLALIGDGFSDYLQRLPETIRDPARVHDAGDGWHDPLPTLYSALGRRPRRGAQCARARELFISMAGDISWDGEPIAGMSDSDRPLLTELTESGGERRQPGGHPGLDPGADRRQRFPDQLGVEPLVIDDEKATGRIVVDERHLHPRRARPRRRLGGARGLGGRLADVPAPADRLRLHDRRDEAERLRGPRSGDELIAIAEHLHAGRSTHVVEVRVTKDDRPVANLIVTQFRAAAARLTAATGTRWTSNMLVPSSCSGRPAVMPIRSPDAATLRPAPGARSRRAGPAGWSSPRRSRTRRRTAG